MSEPSEYKLKVDEIRSAALVPYIQAAIDRETADLQFQLDAVTKARDKAEAACGQMRAVLLTDDPTEKQITVALSTDCGKNWRSPEEWERRGKMVDQLWDSLQSIYYGSKAKPSKELLESARKELSRE